jgi:PPM family protein phosphatase
VRTAWGSATDRGQVRSLNEDALLAYPPVFLVADGMGGHAAGDVASRLTVEEFSRLAGRPGVSADEVHDCFHRVATRLQESLEPGRTAGTTVAGVAVATHEGGAYWLVFNIGDSRVYRYAEGLLEQISVDHSVVQELMDEGVLTPEAARNHPERHVITRAVGTGAAPEPDYWLMPAAPGDRILVCSDGLTSELTDDVLARALQHYADPQDAAQALVTAAVQHGGHDNVSAVVVDVAAVHEEPDVDATVEPAARQGTQTLPESPTSPAARTADAWDEMLDGATVPRPTRTRLPEVQ